MEERRKDDGSIAVLSQKLTDFICNTEKYRQSQEGIQNNISNKLDRVKEVLDKLPCEGRRLIYLENKEWINKNLIAIWTCIAFVVAAIITVWVNKQ